ncbi:MAG: hypothetical protein ACFFAH_09980 [Promethearchaeota archaeon]
MTGLNEFFGAKTVINAKTAKIEIEIMIDSAKPKLRNKEFQDAIDIYNNAKNLAINWNLSSVIENLDDLIRLAQINGLKELKEIYINQAISAENGYNYTVAVDNYDKAIKITSEIFKLGDNEIQKELRKLKKKKKGISSILS